MGTPEEKSSSDIEFWNWKFIKPTSIRMIIEFSNQYKQMMKPHKLSIVSIVIYSDSDIVQLS